MNRKELQESYEAKKDFFHNYINNIKHKSNTSFYTITNSTLIKNPYISYFSRNYFKNNNKKTNKITLFLKTIAGYYLKNIFYFFTYLVSYMLYKLYCNKKNFNVENCKVLDVYVLVDNVIKDKEFKENYFSELYEILKKKNLDYVILPRLYGIGKNPFKLIKFFKIINKDKRNFIFEFELLNIKDFFILFFMILKYPFKTLELIQTEEKDIDVIFNKSLIKDISAIGISPFTRYIFGKNIADRYDITEIYSWSEFQVVERSFNYGVRIHNDKIKLNGCQFYLNYETYFNTYVDDIDFEQKSSFHKVFVNGNYYLLDRKKVKYEEGVSLRYKNVFSYSIASTNDNILLLGSFIESDTQYMLECVSDFKKIQFKNHPAVNINNFGKLSDNIIVVNENIYKLFENTKIVIGTASGSSLEAVTCGISVIIIASNDNLTANPLVEYGKGKIWDIAFSKNDVKFLYNKLVEYRKNNIKEIKEIADWYKKNFFVEPTVQNIIKTFDIN